ncbi:MAG: PspC domain-containing protein [Bacteroidales bacterium]|nr:PspC domain-containing protein [Bacteroidales bacterium]
MSKKLRRSFDHRIAGVCGGIAEYFDIDATLVRIGYALLSILSVAFPGILVYLVLWLIIPKNDEWNLK